MKKILSILLSFVLVFAICGNLIACERENGGNSGSDDGGNSSVVTTVPELVVRNDIETTITENVMNLTVGQITSAFSDESGAKILQLKNAVLNDVLIGDFAQIYIGDVIKFNYYDDGVWRLSNGVAFTPVPNAIFNYQIGSDKPLNLTSDQLVLYGNNTVISCFTDLFAINASTIIPEFSGDAGTILNAFTAITVNELYAITAGDYTFFANFASETQMSILVGAICELSGLTDETAIATIKAGISGTIAEPEIDLDYYLGEILPSIIESIANDSEYKEIIDSVCAIASAIIEYYDFETGEFDALGFYEENVSPAFEQVSTITLNDFVTTYLEVNIADCLPESLVDSYALKTMGDIDAEIKAALSGEESELVAALVGVPLDEIIYVIFANFENSGASLPKIKALMLDLFDGTVGAPSVDLSVTMTKVFAAVASVTTDEETLATIAQLSEFYGELTIEEFAALIVQGFGSSLDDYADVTIGELLGYTQFQIS